jgi:high-affinity iron transporter
MGASFVVTLREAFEATLLLGIVYTYLERLGGRHQFRWVTLGAVAGAVASVLLGVVVTVASGPLLDLGPDVVALVVIAAAILLLTWHGWWMQQHARAVKGDVERRIDEARASRRVWLVGMIAFTGVFREGAETVLFLWGVASQSTMAGSGPLVGATLGVASAAGLGWLVFRGGRRISLRRFFLVTSLVLLFVAAGLASTGIGKLEALGVVPESRIVWDSSALLDDEGVIGSFVGGLTGYRARPTLFELGGYVTYLLGAATLFFGRRAHPHSAPTGDERHAAPEEVVVS